MVHGLFATPATIRDVTQTPVPTTAPAPARPVRRAPADLPFRFADRGLAQALAAEREEPAWLRAERIEAWKAFEALPVEGNQLYTPYIDLRAASLDEVRPYVTDGPPGIGDDLAALPELPLGVRVETFGQWLERDPAAFKTAIEGGASLPSDDKLAMLARGFWSHGRHVEIPAGVAIAAPILLRWPGAAPGRALVTRTIVTLGEGASASIVEELVPSGPEIDCAAGEEVPQGFFHGTMEVVLGAGAALEVASIQEMGERQIVFQHRHARVGEGATLHWALAQLGSRLTRSRVDN